MAKPARGRRRLAIGSSYGPSTWNGGLSSGHWGVLDARIARTVLGRSDGARPFATVCGAGVEPWISCMLAHGRGRWRPPVLRMAFKRSRVRDSLRLHCAIRGMGGGGAAREAPEPLAGPYILTDARGW